MVDLAEMAMDLERVCGTERVKARRESIVDRRLGGITALECRGVEGDCEYGVWMLEHRTSNVVVEGFFLEQLAGLTIRKGKVGKTELELRELLDRV